MEPTATPLMICKEKKKKKKKNENEKNLDRRREKEVEKTIGVTPIFSYIFSLFQQDYL